METTSFTVTETGAEVATVKPTTAQSTYNRQGAVNYATRYWDSNVHGSWYIKRRGGDCTNFISWCLKNGGGWQTTNKWYSNLPYFNFLIISSHGNSWTVANNFGNYMTSSGRASICSLDNKPWKDYFEVGDIVQIDYDQDEIWDHTMIVTVVTNNDMKMTYHTTNKLNKPLTRIMLENPKAKFRGYNLKDSF